MDGMDGMDLEWSLEHLVALKYCFSCLYIAQRETQYLDSDAD